jgi:hypothetical protein
MGMTTVRGTENSLKARCQACYKDMEKYTDKGWKRCRSIQKRTRSAQCILDLTSVTSAIVLAHSNTYRYLRTARTWRQFLHRCHQSAQMQKTTWATRHFQSNQSKLQQMSSSASYLAARDHCHSLPVDENVEPMSPTLMFEYVTEMLEPSASTCEGTPEVVAQVPRATPGSVAGLSVG